MDFAGFPPILAIFYTKFHPTEGPKVVFDVPEGSITRSKEGKAGKEDNASILDFDAISDFIIPRRELCDRVVTVCVGKHRIMGYPVYISHRKYERNALIFNFAFVFDAAANIGSYTSVVRKLGKLFRSLEVQSEYLSSSAQDRGASIFNITAQVLEDLNNYCECMIPIDDSNWINIKLFPTLPAPPPVYAFQVPLCTVQMEMLIDVNWDLTMQKIIPYIDGINSVKRISELADADFPLTRKCIEHLLYYGCIIMIDIFQFANSYATTAEIGGFVEDEALQMECRSYVCTGAVDSRPSVATLFELFCSLRPGVTIREWTMSHGAMLKDIDVRRFITFGVIKGTLYRVHRYPIFDSTLTVDKSLPLARWVYVQE